MRTIVLPGCTIVVQDNPDKLPEHRRIEEVYYSLVESTLGRSIADIDQHFNKMLLFADDPTELVKAINNCRFLFDNLLSKQYSGASLAFAVCIEGVDGIPVDDYSEEGLTALIKQLSGKGLTDEIIIRELGEVKKKSIRV